MSKRGVECTLNDICSLAFFAWTEHYFIFQLHITKLVVGGSHKKYYAQLHLRNSHLAITGVLATLNAKAILSGVSVCSLVIRHIYLYLHRHL